MDSTKRSSRRSDCRPRPCRRSRSPPVGPATARRRPTRCCARSRPAWRSSRRIAGTVTSRPTSIRSAREPVGDASLEPATYGLTPALQSAIPASVLHVKVPGNTLAEILPRLRETYARRSRMRSSTSRTRSNARGCATTSSRGATRSSTSPQRQIEFLSRLTKVEAFDRYVRKTFLGQKTFSGEGLDVMVPMLEEMLDMLADDGVADAVLGMAHRGRLNVIAHVVNLPYEEVMTEFEAAQYRGNLGDDDVMGDVKYHHGATGDVHDVEREDDPRNARAQPEPSGGGRSRRRGQRARAADRSRARRSDARPQARRSDPDSRRRGLHRSGHRLRGAEYAVASRL